jgi:hypothetical protein
MIGTPPGGIFSGQGVSSNVFDPAAAGLGIWPISYSYTDTNACSNSDTVYVMVDGCVDSDDLSKQEITLYPNPSGYFISFTNNISADAEIKIWNQSGQLIKSFKNEKQIYVGDLSTGIYYVQMITPSTTKTWKLMKE